MRTKDAGDFLRELTSYFFFISLYKGFNMLEEALRMLRVFHDMNLSELSNDLGISVSYLCEIEKGRKRPSVELLNKYAKVFNTKPSVIMFFAESLTENDVSFKKKLKQSLREKIIKFMRGIELVTK